MLTPEANKANAGYRKNINNNIDNFYQSLIRNGVDKRTALELSQKVRNAGSLSNALNVLTSTTTRQMSPISSNRQRTLVASAEPLPLRTIIDGMNAIGHGLSHGYTPGTDAMLSMTNKNGLPILGGYGATMDYTLPIQFTAGFGLGQKGGNKQPSGRLYFRLKPGTIPEDTPKAPAAPVAPTKPFNVMTYPSGEKWTPASIKKMNIGAGVLGHPGFIYVFGDNLEGTGRGGQAVIRGQNGAFGIPTKRSPKTTKDAYFGNPANAQEEAAAITRAVDRIIEVAQRTGMTVVLPADGLGTGLAKLEQKSPKLFAHLQAELARLKSLSTSKQ